MKGTCIVGSMNASSLMEYVDKTVLVRTKQQHESKGVVHTIDPVTKRYGFTIINIFVKYKFVLSY